MYRLPARTLRALRLALPLAAALLTPGCASVSESRLPEDAATTVLTSDSPSQSAAPQPRIAQDLQAALPRATPVDPASSIDAWSLPAWSLVAPPQPPDALVQFQQIDPAKRPQVAPLRPPVIMSVTRQPTSAGLLRITRTRSDQQSPSQATLRQGPRGEVFLQHITLGENLTLESLPSEPILWLPADLAALRQATAPITQTAQALITRDGKPETLEAQITIRAIGPSLLPPPPASLRDQTPLGVEWLLRLDAGAAIAVRIEAWYLPDQGLIHEARFITAKVGPIRVLNRKEAWLRRWGMEGGQAGEGAPASKARQSDQ